LNDGNFPAANELFFRVVESEQERGVDNPEALTYYGWTLALGTRNNVDATSSAQQLELALLALDRAIEMDENYADPYCFVAIIESNFRDDPARAIPFLEQCEANNPPADMADLIAAFSAEIRAEAETDS
jgi:tetratricopeptide (TPR) repeat protein